MTIFVLQLFRFIIYQVHFKCKDLTYKKLYNFKTAHIVGIDKFCCIFAMRPLKPSKAVA